MDRNPLIGIIIGMLLVSTIVLPGVGAKNNDNISSRSLQVPVSSRKAIEQENPPSSLGSLTAFVVLSGHQDIFIRTATIVLVDENNHNFIRIGWTFSGSKTFYLLPMGHTYVLHVLFISYIGFYSASVKVTTDDYDDYAIVRLN